MQILMQIMKWTRMLQCGIPPFFLQNRTKDAQVKGDGGRPKDRAPWIPPGRLSCRRDVGSSLFIVFISHCKAFSQSQYLFWQKNTTGERTEGIFLKGFAPLTGQTGLQRALNVVKQRF